MRSIETSYAFPLAAVKPLEPLLVYRTFCMNSTKGVLASGSQIRNGCPACGSAASLWGEIEGLPYVRCSGCSTLFLQTIPGVTEWSELLGRVSERRHSPGAPHASIGPSRTENVYAPKLDWIQSTLRLQGIKRPAVMEAVTPPSPFTRLLSQRAVFSDVVCVDERKLAGCVDDSASQVQAAVLLESLDRAWDPAGLLESVRDRLVDGGLVFITALVSSGFDIVVLGLHNLYLFPPDRTNCFSLQGLQGLLARTGFNVVELSTPGVLDIEIILAHQQHAPGLSLEPFVLQLSNAEEETRNAFQTFLQQNRMSSFARIVARKAA